MHSNWGNMKISKIITTSLVAWAIVLATSNLAEAATPLNKWDCQNRVGYVCVNTSPLLTGYNGYSGPYGYDTDQNGVHIPHNCTSYVAYRLYQIMKYRDNAYNWLGNASEWAANAKALIPGVQLTSIPYEGEVAQWAGVNHVAWVEKVNYSLSGAVTSIQISDDNYHLGFTSTRILYPGQTGGVISWPDTFIGFPIFGSSGGTPPKPLIQPLTTVTN